MAETEPETAGVTFTRRLSAWLREAFGVDLRSLALMRIGVAVILAWDVIDRARSLGAHYTDAGLLPRSVLWGEIYAGRTLPPTLHGLADGAWLPGLLLLAQGILALYLLVGFRTRVVTVLSWVLLTSLHLRNPLLNNAGDLLLRHLLLWGMFLPLGARWSLDRAMDTTPDPAPDEARADAPHALVSVASLALVLQIALIYWCTALLKTSPDWWEGDALYYSLEQDAYVTSFGLWLREQTWMHRPATLVTIWWEALGPFLLFVPWRLGLFRTLCCLIFIGFHAGLELSLEIGIFPAVCMVAWAALLPGAFWDWVARWLPTGDGVRLHHARDDVAGEKLARIGACYLALRRDVVVARLPDDAGSEVPPGAVIVRDPSGAAPPEGDELRALVRASPLLRPIAGVLVIPPLRWLARLQAAIARRKLIAVGWIVPFRAIGVAPTKAASVLVAVMLLLVLETNVAEITEEHDGIILGDVRPVTDAACLEQRWGMFAPGPSHRDGWLVLEAVLASGDRVDLIRDGAPVSFEKPPLVIDLYPSRRWGKMSGWVIGDSRERWLVLRRDLVRWFAQRWNAAHGADAAVASAELWLMEEIAFLDRIEGPRKVLLWSSETAGEPPWTGAGS